MLRLDTVPFLWKKPGTPCENLPEAHLVVRALNAAAAIAAPSLVFKSEAIVRPDEVARYVRPDECRLSYNPLLMCSLWDVVATRDTRHLRDILSRRYATPEGTAWVNYLRCHDDIGWGMANEDMVALGIDPEGHRRFLNAFSTGRFPGSFARGLPLQENPGTGDCRVFGTCTALAGLEAAEAAGDATLIDLAVRRIILLHALVYTMGGIPLICLGDEIAQPNDPIYTDRIAEAADNRWVHRPFFADDRLARVLEQPSTPGGRVLAALVRLGALRKATPALGAGRLRLLDLDPRYTLAFERIAGGERVTIVANLSECWVDLDGERLGDASSHDLWTKTVVDRERCRTLDPYNLIIVSPAAGGA